MMATLGISPSSHSSKPAFLSVRTTSTDLVPRNGILLNGRRESDTGALPPSPTVLHSSSASIRRGSEPVTPSPTTPAELVVNSLDSPNSQPRIRFAPLPDPRRPRSLSQGNNEEWDPLDEKEGAVLQTYEVRGAPPAETYDSESERLTDVDRDIALEDSDDDDQAKGNGRRWSKTMTLGMGGSWKGTKKLLGMSHDKDKELYSAGAPLKKTLSTGTSFKSVAESDRKKVFQGAPLTPTASRETSHRRNSSLEPATSSFGSSLGTSPQPVRMLNGRVYGGRRASEAAARQRELRERAEPAFVEWGFGKEGGGVGSNAARSNDDEDGSGMEWVKRRREERQRRQAAEREAADKARAGGVEFAEPTLSSSVGSQSDHAPPLTPHDPNQGLPTPIIQVSEPPSCPTREYKSPVHDLKPPAIEINGDQQQQQQQHHTQAIAVPQRAVEPVRGRDVFDVDDHGQSGDEEYDDDDEDDGDFSEDEEEEEDAVRTTSSAAGVEVVSRHKN